MNRRNIILSILAAAVIFAAGRFSVSKKVETKEVEKIVYQDRVEYRDRIVKDTEMEQTKTITEVVHPDGTKVTTTTIDTHRKTSTQKDTDATKDTNLTKETEKDKTVTPMNLGMKLDLLAGLDVTNPAGGYVFGLHISKPLIGPINFGAWALSNRTAGLSAGLQF